MTNAWTRTYRILSLLVAALVVYSGDIWAQPALKLAEEVVERTVQRWVPEIIQGTQAVPRCVPFLGRTFGAAAGAAFAFCAFPDKLADGTLTEATPAQRNAWVTARDMAKPRPQGFALPRAATSDDLLEYFQEQGFFTEGTRNDPRNGPENQRPKQRTVRTKMDDLLEDLKTKGHRYQIGMARAELAQMSVDRIERMVGVLCEYRDALLRTRAVQLSGRVGVSATEELDRTFLYFVGLAANQFAWQHDIDGFIDTFAHLQWMARQYAHVPFDAYREFKYRIKAIQTRSEDLELLRFPEGRAVASGIESKIAQFRRSSGLPEAVPIWVNVSEFNEYESLDLETLSTALNSLWSNVLFNSRPQYIEIEFLRGEHRGTVNVKIHATASPPRPGDLVRFERRTAWMKSNPFNLGSNEFLLNVFPVDGLNKVRKIQLEFRLKNRWVWQKW